MNEELDTSKSSDPRESIPVGIEARECSASAGESTYRRSKR